MAPARLRLVSFIGSNSRSLGWCVTACILVLSVIPSAHLPRISFYDLLQPDKAGHLLFYGSACLLLMLGYKDRVSGLLIYLFPAALFLMGMALEWCQSAFTRDRVYDLWDQLANTIGILIGMAVWSRLRHKISENIPKD